jgi:hypothetical protein
VEDVSTVLDGNASVSDRLIAGVSLVSEISPVSLGDLKDAKRIVEKVPGGEKLLSKAADALDAGLDKAKNVLGGKGKTNTRSGTSRPSTPNEPNSIYEQVDPRTDEVRSRTFHDENGRPFSRQDFDHEHAGKKPHEHNREFDSSGRPVTKETVRDLPSGYDNKPTN